MSFPFYVCVVQKFSLIGLNLAHNLNITTDNQSY